MAEVTLSSGAERGWNDTAAPLPPHDCLHHAFEARVDADPDAVAILYGDEAVTYGELEARANRLAHHLVRRGVGPESRVGICVQRGPRVLTAILGVLKAGGAYVPLDPTYPAERLAHMVDTAEVRVLVTEEERASSLPQRADTVLLDADGGAVEAESAERPAGGAAWDNLAYVIFTSGSTGQPKGIALAHRGVANNLADLNGGQDVGPADRVLLLSSLSFDMSVYETLGILAAGGAVVIPRPEELRDPAAWCALCRRHGVTVWNSAPALLGMLADHVDAVPDAAPAGLRVAFLGGDWVPVALPDRVRAWAPGLTEFIVMGGATEASIHSITYPVREVDPAWRSIPYGVPMLNQRAYVLDEALRELAPGESGELFLGGIGLARGYVGRPGFTAERFVPDPHGEPGGRLYRTGDLARRFPDGTIELLGRLDHQVKIRGFRIEPGEIEAALVRHPSVERAVVTARSDAGDNRLVAYLVAADAASPPVSAELRALLRETLPDYMVPAVYVVLDRLPLSASGKVDRKQLPAPPAEAAHALYDAPRTPAEAALAGIWGEVLGAERVGRDDDFFALGGHSLSATRVASRIRGALGVQLSLGEIFAAPTLAALAEVVAGHRSAGEQATPIPRAAEGAVHPLAPAQQRLWLWDQMNPGGTAYNVPVMLRLRGPLDAAALERALDALVRRHDALRTVFPLRDGAPVQQVLSEAPFALPVEALAASADPERALRLRMTREASRPFDLAVGPLVRALLVRVADEEHALLVTMHHIVCDGWSTAILLREASALYDEFTGGAPAHLAELPARYVDYAAWHRERLTEVEGAQLDWWRGRLEGAPTLLDLPTDRPRPAAQSHRGAWQALSFSAEIVERARGLARQEGTTLHTVLLAALGVVLARHARAGEVVLGSTPAGRVHPDTEPMVGFFVNTLPIRADLSGDPDFRSFVRQVRGRTLEAYDHQDVPFDRLVEELAPSRSRSHAPLVQVAVSFQQSPSAGFRLGAAAATPEWVELGTAQFDLTFLLDEDEAGVTGVLEYSTDLFDAATAARIAGHLGVLLDRATAAPDRRVSELSLVDADERLRVLGAWSGAGKSFPADGTLHGRFEAQAARHPHATALTFDGQSLTYADLNARANRLAHRLRALGVGPESRVGLVVERSMELVVGVLAILKAGGAYVPLDPTYPAERLAYMAEDSGIQVVLSQDSLRDRVQGDLAVVTFDADLSGESAEDLSVEVDPSNLAYVIYTSGSTGRPKGVGVTHANVLRLFTATDEWFGFGSSDVWTLFHSYAFDFSVWEIWGALLYGGRLVVVPWEVSRDTVAFRELLARERVTSLSQTPSAFRALAQVDEQAAEPLEHLRTVVFGGEALAFESLRGWLDRYGPARPRLVNMYGITETTVHVTYHPVTGADLREPGLGSRVGVPIPDLRTYVLDAHGSPLPVGVPGELCVGGAGPARGYLGRPALTAERFIPDPFSGEPGARLYRSGDLARWTADGTLEYLGRIDQQVKVRGFRIELGEIEAALLKHAHVAEAAVIVRGEGEDAALVAYIVTNGEAVPASELRDALKRHLPEYMIPAAFVAMDRLPLTANGKLDRKALPEPDASGTAEGDAYIAPRTPTEQLLAGIWAEVLGVERVGTHVDFFALGGHSLRATQVMARVQDAFGVSISLRALFEGPTLDQLAARIDEALSGGREEAVASIVPAGRDRPLPLSFAQQRLWLLDRMQPGTSLYNVPAAWRLRGALKVDALQAALGEVVRRHESLRTVFRVEGVEPVQVIVDAAPVPLPLTDLTHLAADKRDAEVARLVRTSTEGAFDLARGPLLRAGLVRVAEDEHLLLLCMHHIVSDGWSLGVLFGDLAALYEAFARGAASPLAEPSIQYADYAVWQREHLAGERLRRQVEWWGEHLAGAPTLLELPTDRPRPAVQSYRGAMHRFRYPAELSRGVDDLARREGATAYMVLLAAYQVLLSRYSRQDDVVVGSPIANRGRAETEGVIGFFVNTIAVRGDLSGDPTFAELLARLRDATLSAYAHQEVPFEKLVEELHPGRSLSHNPLFQAFFALQNGWDDSLRLAGVEVEPVPVASPTAKFDVSLFLEQDADGMKGELEYATDLFDAPTVDRFVGHLRVVLEAAIAAPNRRLSELPLLDDAGREQVLGAWSGAGKSFPADGTLHGRFEAQAARHPDATALTFDGESLTYSDLNARANRLAHRLRALGVGPESRVGLVAERSMELVVGVLAILKAGGAYVPLDPTYPAERLAYMAEDSAVRVVLAQSHLTDRVAGDCQVLTFDADLSGESAEDLSVEVDPSNLAYVIYTSGSTGRPKGVGVTHANVLRLFTATDEWFGFGADDVWTLFHSYAFDFSVWEIWGALLYGGRLVVVPWEVSRDTVAFRELLARERVTSLSQTPSAFRALAQVDEQAAEPLEHLRTVVFGGEALAFETLRGWLDRYGPARPRLVNMYGITETTVHVTYHPVTGADLRKPGLGSRVGVPIPDLRTYVLDAHGSPLPVGVPGELCVGGAGPARGYLGRPALTAERFIPDPFSGEPGARLYRSGDLARWTADGTLEYLGRIDQQVKVRGFRIELGEIEAALLKHPRVAEAAVIVRGTGEDAALVAYIVTSDAVQTVELRDALKKHLPEYMIPAAFVAMDRLPLTANGKLDRKALPEPDASGSADADAYVAPRTPTEELLAGIWAEVLGVERVGAEDDFFALGGHSLRATQVMARVQDAFGVSVPLRVLFESSTLSALAAEVDAARGEEADEQRRLEELLARIESGEMGAHSFAQ